MVDDLANFKMIAGEKDDIAAKRAVSELQVVFVALTFGAAFPEVSR